MHKNLFITQRSAMHNSDWLMEIFRDQFFPKNIRSKLELCVLYTD